MADEEKNASDNSALRDQQGTSGFDPKLSGHGKVHHTNTSSFDADAKAQVHVRKTSRESGKHPSGQEESGRERQATTSAAGRVLKDNT